MAVEYFGEADLDAVFFKEFSLPSVARFQDPETADYEFAGIFEDPYSATQMGTYRVVFTEPTVLAIATEEILALRRNDTLEIGGQRYIVLGKPEQDGTGVARIKLAEESFQDGVSDQLTQDPEVYR